MAINSYVVGSQVLVEVTFKDQTGAVGDPDTVAVIYGPLTTIIHINYVATTPESPIVRVSTGVYRHTVTTSGYIGKPALIYYKWTGAGTTLTAVAWGVFKLTPLPF